MRSTDVLLDLFDRLPPLVRSAVEDLDAAGLRRAPAPGANPIGWLVWHCARVQDAQVAEVAGREQVWTGGDWAARCGLPPDPADTGYGHAPDQVAAVRPESWRVLVDYHAAVADRTRGYLAGLADEDLDRVVDEGWDPPVTLGVRLGSTVADVLQHAGQAAYVRGLPGS